MEVRRLHSAQDQLQYWKTLSRLWFANQEQKNHTQLQCYNYSKRPLQELRSDIEKTTRHKSQQMAEDLDKNRTYRCHLPIFVTMSQSCKYSAVVHQYILCENWKGGIDIVTENTGWRGYRGSKCVEDIWNQPICRDVGIIEDRRGDIHIVGLIDADFSRGRGVVQKSGSDVGHIDVPARVISWVMAWFWCTPLTTCAGSSLLWTHSW